MINLSSLSALIRSLRHTSGPDGPAAPVARVASVTAVAGDDAGAMTSTAVRASPWTRAQRVPLDLSSDAGSRSTGWRREPPLQGTHAAALPDSRSQPPAAAAANEDSQSAALDFTAGARLLQAALRGTALRTPTPPVITSPMPLVARPRGSVPELAESLAGAVAGSGLFYESHLARALQREYPMAALSREPQAGWRASAAAEGVATSTSAAALPEAATVMLTKQLDALDTRALVWSGELWPGQRATLAFESGEVADAPEDADDAVAPVAPWRLQITIDLPSLGRVQTVLDLRAAGLDLALAAPNEDAQARLTLARGDLATALANAQLALRRFDVAIEAKS